MDIFTVMGRMIKASEPWEWGYLAVLILLTAAAGFHSQLGLPVLVVGFLLLPVVGMFLGLFFIIDNMRNRAG